MDEQFTEEALKTQDGKKVPLTLEIGGSVISEATLRYTPGTGELVADMKVYDVHVAKFLTEEASAIIFEKGN